MSDYYDRTQEQLRRCEASRLDPPEYPTECPTCGNVLDDNELDDNYCDECDESHCDTCNDTHKHEGD